MAARCSLPTVYAAPLRRRSSCRSRRSGLLRRTAVSKHRHRSRGFRAGRKCQRNSATLLGPGPQARRTLATFLLWKVARPQAEYPLKQNRGFAAAAASFFLSDQKETKESPGVGIFRKDLRLTPWSFRSHVPPDPRFLRGSQRGTRAIPSGAVPSGTVSKDYRCRSAQ